MAEPAESQRGQERRSETRQLRSPSRPGGPWAQALCSSRRQARGLADVATADGGKTWHDVATSGLSSDWMLSLAAADPSDLIAVVATGNSQTGPGALFVSHDGGVGWSPAGLG